MIRLASLPGLAACLAWAMFPGPAVAQLKALPAPSGSASQIALAAIRSAEHPCPKLASAERRKDGSIFAVCSNREEYLVFRVSGIDDVVAFRCSQAWKLRISCYK